MKTCPTCQTQYTDDTLKFCLQDGARLEDAASLPLPTVAFGESETVLTNRPSNQMNVQGRPTQPTNWLPNQTAPSPAEAKKSNTAGAVFLTAFLMLLFFSLAGLGAWLYLRGVNPDRNANLILANRSSEDDTTANTASKTNRPVTMATTTPTVTAANTNAAPEIDREQIKKEASGKIYAWKSSMESGSLNSVMSHYADRLNYYYTMGGVTAAAVRSNKQKAFEIYNDFRVSVSNLQVTPDESGQKATVVFDKEWDFEGPEKSSRGKVQAQFQLTKTGGQWLITGERDLKVYYTK